MGPLGQSAQRCVHNSRVPKLVQLDPQALDQTLQRERDGHVADCASARAILVFLRRNCATRYWSVFCDAVAINDDTNIFSHNETALVVLELVDCLLALDEWLRMVRLQCRFLCHAIGI